MKYIKHSDLHATDGEYVLAWDNAFNIIALGVIDEEFFDKSGLDFKRMNILISYELHADELADGTLKVYSRDNHNDGLMLTSDDRIYMLTEDEVLSNIVMGSI